MSIEVYPADFSTRYELSHAISISESILYNGIAKFQTTVPTSDYNIAVLRVGSIVFDTDRNTTFIIVNTKCDTIRNTISASGYTANWLLNKRAVAVGRHITNIESGVYGLISDNLRGLPRINLASLKGLAPVFMGDDPTTADVDESVVESGQLGSRCIALLDYGKLGHRMVWDASTLSWTFEVYQGVDRRHGIRAVSFVEEQGTCTNLVITEDVSTMKNAAYSYVEMTDGTRELISVGSASGNERSELWVDVRLSQEEEETNDAFIARAKGELLQRLSEHINRSTFTVNVDPTEFGVLYNLGDKVNCVSSRFGVSFAATITGVNYTLDIRGENTSIILGDTILTALEEMRLNG